MDRKKASKIYSILKKEYPDSKTSLNYTNVHELLISTILSAQCTDARVNIVTKDLFRKYRSVSDFAHARQGSLEKDIRSTGFFRSKARNIIAAARKLEKDFGLKVPNSMEDLLTLPGVARKTANIVLFHGFGKIEGIAVDTHVKRISSRIPFSKNNDPKKIEKDLMTLFMKDKWGDLTNILIAHGRKVCKARSPLCSECPLEKICEYPLKARI
jgi:endonuclease III